MFIFDQCIDKSRNIKIFMCWKRNLYYLWLSNDKSVYKENIIYRIKISFSLFFKNKWKQNKFFYDILFSHYNNTYIKYFLFKDIKIKYT